MKVVFASHNAGKIQELSALLLPFELHVIPQSELNVEEVPETAPTFVENALIKARHAAASTGLPAIADDSGLAVDALHGAPGIYSARYAGPSANSVSNIKKLLTDMQHVPDTKRQAQFHCVLVYLEHAKDPTPIICHATWSGIILKEPRGEKGFGYDPVFFDPEQNCSAAELSLSIKNKISHRGKALHLLINELTKKRTICSRLQ
jgi:XTP/dITP diphosphohydrolase